MIRSETSPKCCSRSSRGVDYGQNSVSCWWSEKSIRQIYNTALARRKQRSCFDPPHHSTTDRAYARVRYLYIFLLLENHPHSLADLVIAVIFVRNSEKLVFEDGKTKAWSLKSYIDMITVGLDPTVSASVVRSDVHSHELEILVLASNGDWSANVPKPMEVSCDKIFEETDAGLVHGGWHHCFGHHRFWETVWESQSQYFKSVAENTRQLKLSPISFILRRWRIHCRRCLTCAKKYSRFSFKAIDLISARASSLSLFEPSKMEMTQRLRRSR